MSNFAAMSGCGETQVSPSDKDTSKIIDASLDANYAFLDVSVVFRIFFSLEILAFTEQLSTDSGCGNQPLTINAPNWM
jgi:hypothetical protein